MSGSKHVFQLWVIPTPAKREGLLTGLSGFEALMGDEELHREFEKLLKPALDWFRYGKGLYFVYTDRSDDFWRTRLVPTVDQFLLSPISGPVSGKMDQKLWRWLREVLQLCAFEYGDRIFVWPAGKPENAVSGAIATFTENGRPSINFDNPMKAFPLDGNLAYGREHPVADKPSDETVLTERGNAIPS